MTKYQLNKKTGSSETIRKISTEELKFQSYLEFGTPMHRPNPNISFLEWFIGFYEAEGSFFTWKSNEKGKRFRIEVTQKDAKLIYRIRTELGFGKVQEIKRENTSYWRYYVEDYRNIQRLILLLQGNLILEKKKDQFQSILREFEDYFDVPNSLKETSTISPKLSLETAWLSGFLEGDGGFWVSDKSLIYTSKTGKQKWKLRMKFYVTQKGEKNLLEQLPLLLGHQNFRQLSVIVNKTTNESYYRYETNSLAVHLSIREYLRRFPFRGQRAISLSRWNRLLEYRLNDYPVTPKSNKKLLRLISATKKHCC